MRTLARKLFSALNTPLILILIFPSIVVEALSALGCSNFMRIPTNSRRGALSTSLYGIDAFVPGFIILRFLTLCGFHDSAKMRACGV